MYSISCKQLNLFQLRPDLISNRKRHWLKNVASAISFAFVGTYGACDNYDASDSDGGVRPAALIY